MVEPRKSPLKEAFKEVLRVVVFSLPAAIILLLTESPELAGAFGAPILLILRAVDKAIHVADTDKQGLVPF